VGDCELLIADSDCTNPKSFDKIIMF